MIVETVQINNNMKFDYNRREITLKIKLMDSALTVSNETLQKKLEQVFRCYEDGRNSFDVETIERGLTDCITVALSDAITDEERAKYGDGQMIDMGNGVQTNKVYIEAGKRKEEVESSHVSCLTCIEVKNKEV